MLQSSSCTLVSWFGPLVCWYSLQYFCPEPWYFNFPTDALSNILELIFSTSINYHINLSFIHIIHGHSWAFVTNFVTTTICSSYFSKKSDLSNFWTPEGYTIHWVLEPFYQEISEILLVIFLLPCEHSIKKKKKIYDLKAKKRNIPEPYHTDTLILDFQPSAIWGNKFPLFKPPSWGLPGSSSGKDSTCNAGDPGSIPEWGRSAEGGIGYLLQYSDLENSMNRGAWWAIVHGVMKS